MTVLTTMFLLAVQIPITLTWTAPSDEGNPVSVYDVRVDTIPLSIATWDDAIQLTGEPFPGQPGSAQFMTAELDEGHVWYCGLRSADGSGNWSPLLQIAIVQLWQAPDVNRDRQVNVVDVNTIVCMLWQGCPY